MVKNISARGSAHLVIPEGAEQLVMDALGLWASAYMPVRLEVRALGNPTAFAALLIGLSIAVVGLEVAGRARAARWAVLSIDEPPDPLSALHVLDISSVAQRA